MEIKFTGKRALVTGAAQGIGLAIVKKLVSCGAQVVAIDVKGDQMKEALKELPGVETIVADLSNWESTSQILKTIGRVQLVVNNAGIFIPGFAHEIKEEDVDRTFDVNLKAAMVICKHVVNDLVSAELGGAIVNIASVGADKPKNDLLVSCASKAAIVQYTRCLALDCAPKGIRVNAVSPGATRTELSRLTSPEPETVSRLNALVPMKDKICEPEDIANAVAFLLCDEVARKITGVNLYVDGGAMLT